MAVFQLDLYWRISPISTAADRKQSGKFDLKPEPESLVMVNNNIYFTWNQKRDKRTRKYWIKNGDTIRNGVEGGVEGKILHFSGLTATLPAVRLQAGIDFQKI